MTYPKSISINKTLIRQVHLYFHRVLTTLYLNTSHIDIYTSFHFGTLLAYVQMHQIDLLHLEILAYNHYNQAIIYYTSTNDVESHSIFAQATILYRGGWAHRGEGVVLLDSLSLFDGSFEKYNQIWLFKRHVVTECQFEFFKNSDWRRNFHCHFPKKKATDIDSCAKSIANHDIF